MYLPSSKSVQVIRRSDFRLIKEDKLPGISALIDGLSRQASIEVDEDTEREHASAEAHLLHCVTALHQETPRLALPGAKDEFRHRLPKLGNIPNGPQLSIVSTTR